ncbi:MAG: hypothetical protein AAF922_14275 [Pseudomonadota bacterium]
MTAAAPCPIDRAIDPDILDLLGPELVHVTAKSNVESIVSRGLRSAADLAAEAGFSTEKLLLRRSRLRVGKATLTHQRPLASYYDTAEGLLTGHTPESWAAQLDRRVFFWHAREASAFSKSIARDLPVARLWFNTGILIDALAPWLDICPLNSGSFRQGGGGKPRGDWIYVPVTRSAGDYRMNRQRHIQTKTRDTKIREISCRISIPPDLIQRALLTENT